METGKNIKGISTYAKDFLLNCRYTGNVRELKNIIERMVILTPDNGIVDLAVETDNDITSKFSNFENIFSYKEAKQQFESQYIKEALIACNGNITKAADLIQLSRRQLFNKITELKIDVSIYN